MRYPTPIPIGGSVYFFAAFALAGCDRASIRPYPSDLTLPEVPATLIDILPEDMVIAEPEKPETGEDGERPADTQTPAENKDNDAASSDIVDNAQLSPEDNSETPEEELAPLEPALESLINPVYFDLDAYNISVEDKLRLNKLAERLRRPVNQHLNLRIEGIVMIEVPEIIIFARLVRGVQMRLPAF